MKKLLLGLLIFALFFTLGVGIKNFALSQNDENDEEKVEAPKIEKFMKKQMEKVMNQIEKITEEMGKVPKRWGRQNFFVLNPANEVMAGGTLENVTSTGFTLNSNGFRTNWVIVTSTKVVGLNKQELNVTNLQENSPVRIKGKFDGQNLIAEVIIVLQPVQVSTPQLQNLLLQIINMLRERGVDVNPILQQLQIPTTTQ